MSDTNTLQYDVDGLTVEFTMTHEGAAATVNGTAYRAVLVNDNYGDAYYELYEAADGGEILITGADDLGQAAIAIYSRH